MEFHILWWSGKILIVNIGNGSHCFYLTLPKAPPPYLGIGNETFEKSHLEITNKKLLTQFTNRKQVILRNLCKPYPAAAAATKSLQSCPTLCNPLDRSPQGSPVPGILQARTLEWVAISFSNAWKWKVKGKSLSHVRLLATPWTTAHQAPPSMGFSRQEYWSGVPLPSPKPYPRLIQFLDIY